MILYDYPSQKYTEALESLIGDGELKARLFDAAMLLTSVVPDQDIPDKDLRRQHEALSERLSHVEHGEGDGTIAKTLNQMTTEEAVDIAEAILDLGLEFRILYETESKKT